MAIMYDVIIIGGGPAGMSAALVLARCLRKIIVCDTGKPRNRWAIQMNGFLTRDGTPPAEFTKTARQELSKYAVEWVDAEAVEAACQNNIFSVTLANGKKLLGRKLLIATGLKDTLPDIKNVDAFYGKSVHHCPYCDGYEHRQQALIAYGKGSEAKGLALSLKTWSSNVTLCTDGLNINRETQELLHKNKVNIQPKKISELVGLHGKLEGIAFTDGSTIPAQALFFVEHCQQQSEIIRKLNCNFTQKGVVKTDRFHKTNIQGVYVAGDADKDMQQVIVAAAEGSKAAISINKELQEEERMRNEERAMSNEE